MSKIVVYDPGAAVVDAVIEYNPSANTPDYDSEPNKLVNPDLSLLEGIVPVLYWKRVGSTVVEMNQTEKETIDPQVPEERALNEGAYDPPTENAGWTVDRGGVEPDASLMWNESTNQWEFGTIGDIRPLGSVNVSDEGVDQGFATELDFVGGNITATVAAGVATITVTGGTGDVTAAANITDNALVRGDGGVKGVQDSGILINDSDEMSGVRQLVLEHNSNSDLNLTFDPDGLFGAAGASISKGAAGGGFLSLMPNSEILQWIAGSPTAANGANDFYWDVDNQGILRLNTLPGAGKFGEIIATNNAPLRPAENANSDLGTATERWNAIYGSTGDLSSAQGPDATVITVENTNANTNPADANHGFLFGDNQNSNRVIEIAKNPGSADGVIAALMNAGNYFFVADGGYVKIGNTAEYIDNSYDLLVDEGVIGIRNAADQTVGIDVPVSGVTDWTLTLPTTAGSNGQALTTDGSGNASWTTIGGGGDVSSSANITDNSIVRGDGGVKNIQDSDGTGNIDWTIDDNGVMTGVGNTTGYVLSITNEANPGNGFSVTAGESLGDIAFHIADLDDTFQIMEMEADQGYVTMGKTYAQTLTDNGIVYGLDIQHPSGNATDFNTQAGTYRIAGVDVIMPTGGTAGQVLEKIDGTDYNTQWADVSLPDNPTIGGDEKLTLPTGTTAQRPSSPVNGDVRYNTTTDKVEAYEGGQWINFRQADVVLARYTFFADQVEYPVTGSDWNVTVGAPAASDSNNSSMTVRLFDDSVTEAIGMIAKVPNNATEMIVRTKTRAETGANQDVAFQLHRRVIPDNGAIGGWNVSTLTIVDVTSDERWQLDESSNTLTNWNIGAGDTVQFMLARNPGLVSDTLVGDAVLLFVELEFM